MFLRSLSPSLGLDFDMRKCNFCTWESTWKVLPFCTFILLLCCVIAQACVIRLDLDPSTSQLNYSAIAVCSINRVSNITSALSPRPGSAPIGLSGSMFLRVDGAPECPSTLEAWATALVSTTLSSSPSPLIYKPLDLYPPLLSVFPGALPFPVNFSGLTMNIDFGNISTPTRGPSQLEFTTGVRGQLTAGQSFSNDPVCSSGPTLQAMGGESFTNTTQGVLKLLETNGARELVLSFPAFAMKLVSVTERPARNAVGILTHMYEGSVTMKAVLNCPRYCGDFGKCVATKSTSYACQCECGWALDPSTGQCTVPQGVCSLFANSSSAAQLVLEPPIRPPPSTPTTTEDTPPGSQCPAGSGYIARTRSCRVCPSGFQKQECGFCRDNAACQAALNSQSAVCSSNLTYSPYSVGKNYSCAVLDKGMHSVLGTSLSFSCRATSTATATVEPIAGSGGLGSSKVVGEMTPHCRLEFAMGTIPAGQSVVCLAERCQFAAGGSNVDCAQISCTCPSGCQDSTTDWSAVMSSITGRVMLSCTAGGECSMQLGSLGVKVATMCEASECLDPLGTATLNGSSVITPETAATDPWVIASPLLALAVALLALGGCFLTVRPYLRADTKAIASWSNGALPAVEQAASASHQEAPAGSELEGGAQYPGQEGAPWTKGPTPLPNQLPYSTPGGPIGEAAESTGEAACKEKGAGSLLPVTVGGGEQYLKSQAGCMLSFTNISCSVQAHTTSTGSSWPSLRPAARTKQSDAIKPVSANGSVELQKGWRSVLHEISGQVHAGELMGVLGPSGSGKSTLLNILTGTLQDSSRGWRLEGKIHLGQQLVSGPILSRTIAYVPQDDLLLRSLTVREHLLYSAALRLPSSQPPSVVQLKVETLLRALRLEGVRDTVVQAGEGETGGVSGGERRRVSIAMELVTDLPVLVLDEPTSGLDSYNALNLVHLLRQELAQQGRAILLSIHQPSTALLALLDQVMLMAYGHRVFLCHPTKIHEALLGLGAPCPHEGAVADHMLFAVSDLSQWGGIYEKLRQWEQEGNVAAASSECAGLCLADGSSDLELGSAGLNSGGARPAVPVIWTGSRSPSLARQLGVLTWRSSLDLVRNPWLALLHALMGLMPGLVVGAVFYQVPDNTTGAQNRLGGLFVALAIMAFTCVTTIDTYWCERNTVSREIRRHFYNTLPYISTKVLLDALFLRFMPCLIFTLPFYFLMGLQRRVEQFFVFFLTLAVFDITVGGVAMGLSITASSPGKAVLVMNMVLLLALIFGGFLANKSVIPHVLRWITYLSPFRYAWEAMVINEFSNSYLTLGAPGVDVKVVMKGEAFVKVLGVDPALMTTNLGVLAALCALCFMFPLGAMVMR